MKKITFLFIVFAISILQILNAQTWDAPAYKGSTPVSGTEYYIFNVGSNGFLNRGGEWGAEAVVTAKPIANAVTTIVKWTVTNVSGSTWTFMYNATSGKYLFASSTDANGWVYTDGGTGAQTNWTLVQSDATNLTYTMQISSAYVTDAGSLYLGSKSTTYTSNKGLCNDVRYRTAAGDNYTQWKFISQSDYDLYNAKVLLDKYMQYAKLKGGIDLTSYITTYNSNVTADINTASTNLLATLAPVDATSLISNPSFETNFTGWTNGGFVTQTSLSGMGWTKDGTNYAEKWVNSGTNLPATTLTQTVAVPNGVYQLVASGHAVQQAGSNPLHTNAFIKCGTGLTEISSGGDYVVSNVEVTNGSLPIGYVLQGTVACNWTGFDNFRLYRYITYSTPTLGASQTSLIYDDIYSSSSISINGSNLTSDIAITVPSGITLSGTNVTGTAPNYLIAAANANASNSVTVLYNGSTNVNGTIALSATGSGNVPASASITVKGSPNSTCYTPLYSTIPNMISDPTFSKSITGFANGGYGGWGPKGIIQKNAHCGGATAYVLGSCYPNGGSLDRALTATNGNALKPNTTYRLRAMVNSQASTGSFQFEIAGYDGNNSKLFQIPNSGGWVQFDETFTTGATVTEKGIYFNSCTNPPAVTDTCFIDNYELYALPSLSFTGNNTTLDSLIYTAPSSVNLTISASGFSNSLSVVSDNANFVPSVSSLPSGGGAFSVQFIGSASTTGNLTISALNSASPIPGLQKVTASGTSIIIPMKATVVVTETTSPKVESLKVYATNNGVSAQFKLIKSADVELGIYSTNGVLISNFKQTLDAGSYQKDLNIPLSKGIYLVKLTIDGQSITKKLVK